MDKVQSGVRVHIRLSEHTHERLTVLANESFKGNKTKAIEYLINTRLSLVDKVQDLTAKAVELENKLYDFEIASDKIVEAFNTFSHLNNKGKS